MKTKILVSLVALAIGTIATAQIQVEKSATATNFTVGGSDGTYNWSQSDNTVNTAITNLAAVQADVDNSINVVFDGAIDDEATLTVFGISAAGCRGNNLSQSYIIVAPGDLDYTATVSAASASICPQTDNNNGVGAGVLPTFTVNFFLADATTPATTTAFVYQVDNLSSVSVNLGVGATSATINPTTVFTNADAGVHTLYIRSMTTATSGALFTTVVPSANVTVTEAPIVTGL